ncbi:MAG: hypothetical protein K8R53_11200 [Bacteroidales bacterium]|nr:hypothetical protein [Bacteroidales bacterium]
MSGQFVFMLNLPNYLLISGTGQKTGKTTLACALIETLAERKKVLAVKISSHPHPVQNTLYGLYQADQYSIFEEKSGSGNKDSAKMLRAGADKSYYIHVTDSYLKEAITAFNKMIEKDSLVICESPSLLKISEPGISVILDNTQNQNRKTDILLVKDRATFYFDTSRTGISEIVSLVINCINKKKPPNPPG